MPFLACLQQASSAFYVPELRHLTLSGYIHHVIELKDACVPFARTLCLKETAKVAPAPTVSGFVNATYERTTKVLLHVFIDCFRRVVVLNFFLVSSTSTYTRVRTAYLLLVIYVDYCCARGDRDRASVS